MSIETDLNRIANSLELIAAHVTGGEMPAKKGPGRPRKTEAVDPVPETAAVAASPALADAKPAATMPTLPAPTAAAPAAAAPAVEAPAAATGVTVEQLQKLVGEKVGAGKRDGVLAAIAGAGADRASTVPADKRDAVYAAIQKL